MIRLLSIACLAAVLQATAAGAAEDDPKRGAEVYRACVSCHALEPGLHLSGPSLDGVWERQAGTAEGFGRYSPGLKQAAFEWNAAVLDGWLKNPQEMVSGNYMTFRGIDDAQARADLIAFLKIAGQPGGGEKAVAQGFLPESWLRAAAPQALREPPPAAQVASIRHCGDSYFVKTGDGRETPYWEKNIRLKIDSVETGPPPGVPVILQAGMGGDRFSVVFASLADLTSIIEEKC